MDDNLIRTTAKPRVRSPEAKDALTSAEDWPAEGIEHIGRCPVCGSGARKTLFHGVRDKIFHCAPGAWEFQLCGDCGSVYIDPRPTPETIHLAYRQYYTHEEQVRLAVEELRGLRWLQRVLANGYKNWKFGTDLQPSSRLGLPVALFLPVQRATLDRQFRHLPRRPAGGWVLDIGFGDAGFLENAGAMGWRAVGTDLDPEVVENARRRGFDVRLGTVDAVEGPFDVITMSHVIEHLHDPVAVLCACYRLLAPGGTLWLETPNIAAAGLRRFGPAWRGLEPPRHLVLFNRASLDRALRAAGFADVRDLRQPSPVNGMYVMSERIKQGCDPYAHGPVPLRLKLEMRAVKLLEWAWKERREFLAVTARKPA